jgi:hypothetical protein
MPRRSAPDRGDHKGRRSLAIARHEPWPPASLPPITGPPLRSPQAPALHHSGEPPPTRAPPEPSAPRRGPAAMEGACALKGAACAPRGAVCAPRGAVCAPRRAVSAPKGSRLRPEGAPLASRRGAACVPKGSHLRPEGEPLASRRGAACDPEGEPPAKPQAEPACERSEPMRRRRHLPRKGPFAPPPAVPFASDQRAICEAGGLASHAAANCSSCSLAYNPPTASSSSWDPCSRSSP